MTDLQRALGMETTLQHEGQSYRVGPVSLEVMAAWEHWLCREAMDELLRLMPDKLGEDRAIRVIAELAAGGRFDFFGTVSQDRMLTMSGQKKLLGLRLNAVPGQKVSEEIVSAMVESDWDAIIRQHKAERAAEEIRYPNDQAPTTGANTNESHG